MFGSSSRGQALVEFALIAPLFLLIVFGMFQFGLIIHDVLVVNEAAREGARVAAVGANNAVISTRIKTAAPSIKQENLTITISPLDKRVTGDTVTVTVSAPSPITLPYVKDLAPATLQGKVVMRVEVDSPVAK